uniref:Uncharacterized protein n=2 Tax=Macaca TaxID=9539 RepID=A0A5F7ZT67_MACMU|nr:unnamed protein product [Macaca fascicularis]
MWHLGIHTPLGRVRLWPSGAGGLVRNASRAWHVSSGVDVFITSSTVLTLFSLPISSNPQLSPLLCIFFTVQLAVRC